VKSTKNHAVYISHFEHARIAYFERIDAEQMMKATGIGPILAETSCRFRLPLTYPDQVSIGARVTRIEDDRFFMAYRVVSHKHGKIAAEGDGTIVAFDYASNRKASLPEAVRRKIEAVEQGANQRRLI
jgi:acyl-CoA thioester hydrolase